VRTVDEHVASAPPDTCFRIAADVERWPEILPHYRWVRFRRREGFAMGEVEMAAWRHFGPLGYPTWWVSEMSHDAVERTVRYHHVDGITRGMDVWWEVRPHAEGRTLLRIVHEWRGPRWPLVGGWAARHVIGPRFVRVIAGRTLAGIARTAEAAGTAPEGPRADASQAKPRGADA
jgi:ribosome-associated toxin RatA of RatAB toxin-antitoxin module